MISIVRTTSENKDFRSLVQQLDALLAELDGEEHAFYAALNTTPSLQQVVVLFDDEKAVACGALREFVPGAMEVKRMYTLPEYRGKGMATLVLQELERWAAELSYNKCVLETGKRQPEAIALYLKSGYKQIPNYGKYLNVENSVCFEKNLPPGNSFK